MKIKQIAIIVFFIIVMTSCDVIAPNFLVGKWIRSNPYGGTDSFTFSKDNTFVAVYYESKEEVKSIEGSYKAGFSVIDMSFSGEQRAAAYKMYKSSMDLSWNGTTFRLQRLN